MFHTYLASLLCKERIRLRFALGSLAVGIANNTWSYSLERCVSNVFFLVSLLELVYQ